MYYWHSRAFFLCLELPYPLKPQKRSVPQKLTAGFHCQWQWSHNSLNVERPSMGTHGAIEVPASCALVSLVEEGTQKATERETGQRCRNPAIKPSTLKHLVSLYVQPRSESHQLTHSCCSQPTPSHLVHPYFGWAFSPRWAPWRKPSTSCCLHFFIMMDCNLELSAKERLSSLNCCCWVLDSSNREQNWNLVCRQQDEGMWKKMLFYYHGWQLQEKARECLGHPRQ